MQPLLVETRSAFGESFVVEMSQGVPRRCQLTRAGRPVLARCGFQLPR